MRNLSMKKFGTPIGAAPGCASVKPGLSAVGVPSVLRPFPAASFFFFLASLTMDTTSSPVSPRTSPGDLWLLFFWLCWLPLPPLAVGEPSPEGVGEEFDDGAGVEDELGAGVGVSCTEAPGVAVGAG